jgi:hypothetical protein
MNHGPALCPDPSDLTGGGGLAFGALGSGEEPVEGEVRAKAADHCATAKLERSAGVAPASHPMASTSWAKRAFSSEGAKGCMFVQCGNVTGMGGSGQDRAGFRRGHGLKIVRGVRMWSGTTASGALRPVERLGGVAVKP